jgi:hypothetical protein
VGQVVASFRVYQAVAVSEQVDAQSLPDKQILLFGFAEALKHGNEVSGLPNKQVAAELGISEAVTKVVAAIRKTVFDNSDNIEIYRKHLKQAMETAKPLVDEAMLSYDFLMQRISDSQQWAN